MILDIWSNGTLETAREHGNEEILETREHWKLVNKELGQQSTKVTLKTRELWEQGNTDN